MNKSVLIGRLTKDPELRYSTSGQAVTRFTLAVDRSFKKEGQQEADFINCVAFAKRAEAIANFVKKGHLFAIIGHIQTGSYDAQDGTKRYTTDVIVDEMQFLQPKGTYAADSGEKASYNVPDWTEEYGDGDIPF